MMHFCNQGTVKPGRKILNNEMSECDVRGFLKLKHGLRTTVQCANAARFVLREAQMFLNTAIYSDKALVQSFMWTFCKHNSLQYCTNFIDESIDHFLYYLSLSVWNSREKWPTGFSWSEAKVSFFLVFLVRHWEIFICNHIKQINLKTFTLEKLELEIHGLVSSKIFSLVLFSTRRFNAPIHQSESQLSSTVYCNHCKMYIHDSYMDGWMESISPFCAFTHCLLFLAASLKFR